MQMTVQPESVDTEGSLPPALAGQLDVDELQRRVLLSGMLAADVDWLTHGKTTGSPPPPPPPPKSIW